MSLIDDNTTNEKTVSGVRIFKGPDGLWRDAEGTVFALINSKWSLDDKTRAGVGVFSLPEDHPISEAAKSHDFAYSSPAYQAFHKRIEADLKLLRDIAALTKQTRGLRIKLALVSWVVKWFGGGYWENDRTNTP